MIKPTIIAVALAALSCAALAEDAKPEMTKGDCMEMLAALRALDGYDYVVNDGRAEKVIHRSYKMGDSRTTVALNLSALKPVAEAFQAAQQALVTEIGNGDAISQFKKDKDGKQDTALGETDEWKAYVKRFNELSKQPCGVTLGHLKAGDYKVNDDNPIPPTVLEVILKITDK